MKRIKLFCLPYAGSSAVVFYKMKEFLEDYIDILPIELAGRGRRFGENFYRSIDDALEDIFQIVSKNIDELPFALLGYSLGSILAFELAHKVEKSLGRSPIHIFFAARSAPNIKSRNRILHKLGEQEFLQEVIELGGIPTEVYKEKDLMQLFIPILRADFKLAEEYQFSNKNRKLPSDISVLYSDCDGMINEIDKWKTYTSKVCHFYKLNGGHFFINEDTERMVQIINNTLRRYCQYGR